MAQIQYNAAAPGGQLTASAMAKLLDAINEIENLKGLADEVGNIGGSFDATNFEAANNAVFDVNVGEGQSFYDQITALDSALSTMLATDGNESRIYSLYQAD